MINNIFIFGAKYLFLLSPLVAVYFFYKLSRESQKEIIIFAFFSLPLTFLLGMLAKHLYNNPRPFVASGFNPLIPHAPDNGFPSDHILLLGAIAALVTFFSRKYALALWIIAGLVGISRIYVGIHHSADIIGSIVIALISAWMVYATIAKWNKSNPTNS